MLCCLFLGKLNAQSIGVRLSDSSVVVGNTIDIPIYIDSTLTGKNVYSFQMKLDCNTSNFTVQNIITAGTLSASFGTLTYNVNANAILISGAGTTALTGNGVLCYIKIKPLVTGGIYFQLNGNNSLYFNQGNPSVVINKNYSSINVLLKPSIYTYYYNGSSITIGDSLQIYASGGQQPYSWSVSNSVAANINQNGMLYAKSAGATRVIAQSADGIIDTTDQDIQIRAIKLTIKDSSFYPVSNIIVPITINDVTSSNIFSGSFTLEFSQGSSIPDSLITTGTLLANASVSYQITNNKLLVSFASANKLSGKGNLLKIRFKITNPQNQTLTLSNCLFNQSIVANSQNGYMSFISLPTLGISPNYGEFFTGQIQQYSGYGGKAPYQFKTTDTSIASITENGLMSAKSGGLVRVEIKDSLNTVVQTQNMQVYDAEIAMPYYPVLVGATISYPVFLANFNGKKPIYSMQFTIDLNGTILDSIQVVTNNALSSGFIVTQNIINGKLYVAFAGTNPIRTNGILFRINAKQNGNAQLNSSFYMNMSKIQINETNFYTKAGQGYIQVVSSINRDIGISNVLNLNSSCVKSNNELVVAQLINFNNNPYYIGDTIFLGYNINNGLIQRDTLVLTANINQGNSLIYTFKKFADFSSAGTYALKVFTLNKGDINAANDTSNLQFQVYGKPAVNLGRDTTICMGSSIALNASILNGRYLWNTSETNANIQVNTSGLYWVKVLNNYDCAAFDTIQVATVNAPTVRSLNGTPYIGSCGLDSIVLYTPTEAGIHYRWYKNGSPTLLLKDTLNSLMVNQTGQYNVQLTNVFGCYSMMKDTSIVLANSRPAIPSIIGKTSICENDTIQLSLIPDAALNYYWKGPNGFIQNGIKLNRANADTLMSGIYQLFAIKKNAVTACDTSNAYPFEITVHAKPAQMTILHSGSLSYCKGNGDSATLYMNKLSGFKYNWSTNNVFNNTDTNSFLIPKQTGTYNVQVSNTFGCSNLMNPIGIEVKNKPVTGPITGNSTVVKNSLQTYSVAQTTGSTYQWIAFNGTLQTNNSNITNVRWDQSIGSGNIIVTETAANGCSGESSYKSVTVVAPFLTVTPDSIVVNHFTNTKRIGIGSNANWTINNTNNWIGFNKNSGNGSDSIAVSISYNNDTTARIGFFTVSCDSIVVPVYVIQAAKPPQIDSLLLAIDTIRVAAINQQTIIGILSNTSWQISSNQNWLTFNKQTGSGNDSIQVNIDANSDSSNRVAIVTVSTVGLSKTVWIEQAGKPKHIDSLSLSQDSIFTGPNSQLVNIDLFANTNWTILNPLSWLHLNRSSGNSNANIQLQIDSLDNNQTSREGYLFVSAGSIQKIIYIKQSLGTGMPVFDANDALKIYPNPANESISLVSPGFAIAAIYILDMNGKMQLQLSPNDVNEPIDISVLKTGIYQLIIQSKTNELAIKKLLIAPSK